jgi:hypothetical protein
MLDRFINLGYVVVTRRDDEEATAAIAAELRAEAQWDLLFGPQGMDHHRLSRPVMSVIFRPHWLGFFPHLVANDWVAVRFLPGGRQQPPHTDFTFPLRYPHLEHDRMPSSRWNPVRT